MKREEFKKLWEGGIVLLDGATGTNLQAAGMPSGVCVEQWILENPAPLLDLQRAFVDAGTQILCAPTFTANRVKLADHGLDKDLKRINTELVALSREAAGGKALVAADMTMTGKQLFPLGPLGLEDAVDVYREQAEVLCEAGADLLFIETMISLAETRAAVIGIPEACDLPVMASMTFEENGSTVFGTSAEAAVAVLQDLGADAVGMNCSTGPEGMLPTLERMAKFAAVPLVAKPNAGLPEIVDGAAVYRTTPEEFATAGAALARAGARFVGGCCGTTPDHIRALALAVRDVSPQPVNSLLPTVHATERAVIETDDFSRAVYVDDTDDAASAAKKAAKAGKKPLVIRAADPEVANIAKRFYPGIAYMGEK